MLVQVAGYGVSVFVQSDVAYILALNCHIYVLISIVLIINEHLTCIVCICLCLFLYNFTTCGVWHVVFV